MILKGIGHFSPIGGYHKTKDLVLIMDVARFKYPPYWLPLNQLWNAMAEKDAVTNQTRGYFVISSSFQNILEHYQNKESYCQVQSEIVENICSIQGQHSP